MRLAKRIIKWSMIGVPILMFVILVIVFNGTDILLSDIVAFHLSSTVLWLLISLMVLGIIKLTERAKHEIQTH